MNASLHSFPSSRSKQGSISFSSLCVPHTEIRTQAPKWYVTNICCDVTIIQYLLKLILDKTSILLTLTFYLMCYVFLMYILRCSFLCRIPCCWYYRYLLGTVILYHRLNVTTVMYTCMCCTVLHTYFLLQCFSWSDYSSMSEIRILTLIFWGSQLILSITIGHI